LLTFCLGGAGGGAALLNCCLTAGGVLAGLYGAAEPASARTGPANVARVSTALALIHFRCRAMGASPRLKGENSRATLSACGGGVKRQLRRDW